MYLYWEHLVLFATQLPHFPRSFQLKKKKKKKTRNTTERKDDNSYTFSFHDGEYSLLPTLVTIVIGTNNDLDRNDW